MKTFTLSHLYLKGLFALISLQLATNFMGIAQEPTPLVPIVCYYFEGNVNDTLELNLHGTIIGHPLFLTSKSQQHNRALYLDGCKDKVTVSNTFQLPEVYTVAAWIKVESFEEEWQTVFAKYETSNYGPFWFGLHHSHVNFWVSDGNGGNTNFDSTEEIPDNEWVHIAWVGKDETGYIYINGELDFISPIPRMTDNDDVITIGEDFGGFMDNLAIYDQALSEDEIRMIMDPPFHTSSNSGILANQEVTLTPNPSNGLIELKLESEVSESLIINVRDALGKQVIQKQLPKGVLYQQIDLSNQNAGIFFVTIRSKGGDLLATRKVSVD